MRVLRYSINVTLDGCVSHEVGLPPDEESMAFWADRIAGAEALLFGRVTFEMMRSAWRRPVDGVWPTWTAPWQIPFAEAIDAARKYVVTGAPEALDWNAEPLGGDLRAAVEELKREPGGDLWVGGVTLPRALAEWGLIDEYEFLVHPVVAGRGPTLLAGLHDAVGLRLVDRRDFASGVTALRYRPAS